MNDEKNEDREYLESVLRDIATNRGATARDRVLAALTLRELSTVSAINDLQKLTRIGNLWRYYRGEVSK